MPIGIKRATAEQAVVVAVPAVRVAEEEGMAAVAVVAAEIERQVLIFGG